jgi:hypothetical protein
MRSASNAARNVEQGPGRGSNLRTWHKERRAEERQRQREQAEHAIATYVSPRLEAMILAHLQIDEHYQRARAERKVDRLRAYFNPNACQPLAVSRRSDGSLFLVDGQHRAAALQDLGQETWMALVYSNLTRREEAAMWSELNTRQAKPKATERFKAKLSEGNPEALAIKSIVEKAGFNVHTKGGGRRTPAAKSEIFAIEALERIYRRNKTIGLEHTLTTIGETWPDPDEADRLQRLVLLGMAGVLHAPWAPRMSHERLVKTLKRSTPSAWISRAYGDRGDQSPIDAFTARVREFYNKGATKKERV